MNRMLAFLADLVLPVSDDSRQLATLIALLRCVGLGTFLAVLFQASMLEGRPFSCLGNAPPLTVRGYDPVRGALPPSLLRMFHASMILGIWSVLLQCFGPRMLPQITPLATMFIASLLYFANYYYWYHMAPGVSQPSGPRPFRIDRVPHWPDRTWPWPTSSWRHYCGAPSHAITQAAFTLSGEAAGRDIWNAAAAIASDVDEALVMELASGGRPPGFQPSKNPNRYVVRRGSLLILYIFSNRWTPARTRYFELK
jgi:hypothetical protein